MIDTGKLKYLHAIRGFAALIVVISHSKFPFWSGGQEYIKKFPMDTWGIFDYLLFMIDMFTSNPAVMVVIFFVLSGFFIAYSFDVNNWKLRSFYTNRFLRVYIPYLASMLLSIILFRLAIAINSDLLHSTNPREYNQGLIENYNNFNIKTVLWNLLFIKNPVYIGYNDPYWSLLIEAMFYIVAPLLVKKPKITLLVTSLLMITGFFFNDELSRIITFPPLLNFIIIYSVFFALGIFLFWLIFKYKIQTRIREINVWFYNITALVLLVISMYIGFFADSRVPYIIGALAACIMIYRVVAYPIKVNFINKILVSLGKVSFSMYLIHVPIFVILYFTLVKFTHQEVFYSRIYWIPALIAVLFSYLFYWLVEAQSLKIIKKYKNYLKRKNMKI